MQLWVVIKMKYLICLALLFGSSASFASDNFESIAKESAVQYAKRNGWFTPDVPVTIESSTGYGAENYSVVIHSQPITEVFVVTDASCRIIEISKVCTDTDGCAYP